MNSIYSHTAISLPELGDEALVSLPSRDDTPVDGSVFDDYYTSKPTFSYKSTSTKKTGTNSTQFEITTRTSKGTTRVLLIDNKVYYEGSNWDTYQTIKVTVEDGSHKYVLHVYDAYGNSNSTSGSFTCDTIAPSTPSNLKVRLSGDTATFIWNASADTNNFTYEIEYKTIDDKEYTSITNISSSSTSRALYLAKDTIWQWRIRAKDSYGNTSNWVNGSDFTNDDTKPTITAWSATSKRLSNGLSETTLSWNTDEQSTYTLAVDGISYAMGSSKSYKIQLRDGTHRYTLYAKDRSNNPQTRTGTFVTDATAPKAPSTVKSSLSGNTATLSWSAVSDMSGVTYEIAYKRTQDSKYSYIKGLTSRSRKLALPSQAIWRWGVRAVDGKGNASAWKFGTNLNNDRTAPVITMGGALQKKISTGWCYLTLNWKTNEKASFTLSIDGKVVYRGSALSRTIKLRDGLHKYILTARDASGNTRRKTNTFRTDTTAPKQPSKMSARVDAFYDAALRWTRVADPSGVRYQVAIKRSYESKYTILTTTTNTGLNLHLGEEALWKWAVRTIDGRGNVSSWKYASFSSYYNFDYGELESPDALPTPPSSSSKTTASTTADIDRELELSTGATANGTAATLVASSTNAASTILPDMDQQKQKQLAALAATL